ncbi:hypothetical protein [Chitinophaga sp. 212800010-3]|jgi:hypothetical protein|uniref:hypothetical protein n=1 Tax=unclassified Chitinophaga TaxID=2619133 RepID=UPI002DF576F8|nr:DUF4468 domain-containing protein [Chitinophaga sp. 212800010-3]
MSYVWKSIAGAVVCCLLPYFQLAAQDTAHYRGMTVNLDEVIVQAKRVGFDVNSFIKRVEEDTTFYRAFKNLHVVGFDAINDIRVLGKNGDVRASLFNQTHQEVKGKCLTMQVANEKVTGDFYTRKGNYNYYTAELYAHLFFTKGVVCLDGNGEPPEQGGGSLARHKAQLKQLVFNPGKPIRGVPIVGQKVAIFNYEVMRFYDFSISAENYVDGTPCYVFTARAKPNLNRIDRADVVIDELVTWFNKDNFEIVGRKYALSYKTMLFDFNVKMNVQMTRFNGLLIPALVTYNGTWNIPFRKRETAVFVAKFLNFTGAQ